MTKAGEEELSDEEPAHEIQEVDNRTPERMATARSLTVPLVEAAMDADSAADIAKFAAAGAPLRDFNILTARRMADHAAERKRRLMGRTRTSPVDPCEDYDPRDFWKAMDAFDGLERGRRRRIAR